MWATRLSTSPLASWRWTFGRAGTAIRGKKMGFSQPRPVPLRMHASSRCQLHLLMLLVQRGRVLEEGGDEDGRGLVQWSDGVTTKRERPRVHDEARVRHGDAVRSPSESGTQ